MKTTVMYAVHIHDGVGEWKDMQPSEDGKHVHNSYSDREAARWKHLPTSMQEDSKFTSPNSLNNSTHDRQVSWLGVTAEGLAITTKQRYNIDVPEVHDIWRDIDGDRARQCAVQNVCILRAEHIF